MKKLNKVYVKALQGQRLTEIKELSPIPSNAKINKTITGLGATYSEMNSDRHSFIIEPNVPVIQGKVEEHNAKPENQNRQILGVHKGIYRDDILAYITSDAKYKKILSTPEGFRDKILPAIKDSLDFYKKNFYLLIDECEKNIQDSSYRGKINAPFDVFFEFENKGLVSATPLEFSDPRFLEHKFTNYIVQPEYIFSQPLQLIHTNNVLESFIDYLKDNPVDQYCIFVNSTNTIEAIIKQLKIKEQSAVFCAEESVDKLDYKDLPIARSEFDVKFMKKFNFFTSRYFSAFDVILDHKPNVVLLTDVYFAKHSILDPSTEVIQIAGRLRNGINKLTHISNFNPKLKSMSTDDAVAYLEGIGAMLQSLINLALNMPHKGQQDFLDQIMKVELARFFKEDGSYDWFMYDNFIHEERVKGYYQNLHNLGNVYKTLEKHFVLDLKPSYYLLGDEERLNRATAENRKDLLKKDCYPVRCDRKKHYLARR